MGVQRRLTLAALLVACAASLAAASGMFATATWLNPGTGNWDTGANWSTGAEPTAADDAVVNNGGTVEVTGVLNAAQSLNAGTGAGLSGTATVTGELEVDDVNIGNGGTGTLRIVSGGGVHQSDGAGSNLIVGDNGNGTVIIEGTASLLDWDGGFVVLGNNGGTATVNLAARGELRNTDVILLAAGGATGTINVGADAVLRADVGAPAGSGPATIHFNFPNTSSVTHSHVISGGVAVTKSGTGTVTLTGANTYTGGTTINGGTVSGNSTSLQGDFVTVFGSAVDFVQDVAGTYAGVISGDGVLLKQGIGTLTLTGMNTYTSTTSVLNGTLRAGATNVFPEVLTQVGALGTLDLNGHDHTFGSLSGEGNIMLGSADVSADGNGEISGIISGSGSLTKTGGSTMTLTGNNTYTGGTFVEDGLLNINGSQPASDVTVTGGQLGGIGTVGDLTATGGAVGPGESAGLLSSGDVSFNSATVFAVEIDGAAPGSGYDVLDVTGTVALGGSTLIVVPGFTPAAGAEFVIIDNDGADAVAGTFAGLAEGDEFTEGGQTFHISYAGGDGNDVTLTAGTATAIAPGTLPDMTVGEPFSVTFTASGGVPPYTFSVSAGALPDGLTLDGSTGELSGTPTTAGPYSFSITATDSAGGTDVQAYSGDVLPAPVPSMPMLGFLGLAALLGAMGYFRLRAGVA